MKRKIISILIGALVVGTTVPALAQDQTRDREPLRAQDRTGDQARTRDRDQLRDQDIYGSRLMSPQERNEYRHKMRAAKTVEERERIRNEHHEQMKVRAKERGVTLPDEPPANRGPGKGPGGGGMGPGSGMGPGGGMGPAGGGR